MALCKLFAERNGKSKVPSKAVLLALAKFLVSQKKDDWEKAFSGTSFKLKLVILTGDTETSLEELMAADIVLSTPEKWDSQTRRWKQITKLAEAIKLLMVDEVFPSRFSFVYLYTPHFAVSDGIATLRCT